MRILVTGSNGFIGRNLLEKLSRMEGLEIHTFTKDESFDVLEEKVIQADFIFHLAGVNRPKDPQVFYEGNRNLTQKIIDYAMQVKNPPSILISSSIQAEMDNDYGKSKYKAEELLRLYSHQTGATVYIYRLPNVFGKWSRPNYNSVIATWCYNIIRELPIQINDENVTLNLVYIDDVINSIVRHIDENGKEGVIYGDISPVYKKTLGEIHQLLIDFKISRESLLIPRVGRGFERALYATYLSFLPKDKFSYSLKGYSDERGTFYEFLKTIDSGQFSISTTAPGVTRGNHYHNTKNEKFLVIQGEASIKYRQIHGDEIIEYKVSDKNMEVVEMIPGYTHNITNTGDNEMILLLWANEVFDRENPDTYFLEVEE